MNFWKRSVLKLRGTKNNVDGNSTPSHTISSPSNKDEVPVNSTPSHTIGDSPDFDISDERIKLIPKISAAEEWQSEVLPQERVVVLFFAIWSSPDKMFTQTLIRVIPEFEDIKFLRLNIDDLMDESNKLIADMLHSWQLYTTPTLVLFKRGEKADSAVGYHGEDQLRTLLKNWSEL